MLGVALVGRTPKPPVRVHNKVFATLIVPGSGTGRTTGDGLAPALVDILKFGQSKRHRFSISRNSWLGAGAAHLGTP